MNWAELRAEVRSRLDDPVDADRIVERACGDDWRLRLEDPVSERALSFVESMVERRAAGEPLQYVVGRWGFRTLDLLVDRRVLIPRPETEQVVEAALRRLPRPDPVVVDLGTGSGAIALAVATEVPKAEVWATDLSPDAVAVARANLAGAGAFVATRVRIVEGSWFEPLPDDLAVDVVISNPPYIADDEELPAEVEEWEPRSALRSGPSGLEAVTEILREARSRLRKPGLVVIEIAPHQAEASVSLGRLFGYSEVRVETDLAGRPRALVATWE